MPAGENCQGCRNPAAFFISVDRASFTGKIRLSLLEKGADAFAIILAVVCLAPQFLYLLESCGIHGAGIAHDVELFLDHGDAQGGVGGNAAGHAISESFQFIRIHQVVEDAEVLGPAGVDGFSRKEHLLGDVQFHHVQEVHHAGGIVWHADAGRGDGKAGVGAAHEDVAHKGQVATSSPHPAVDHGDDRCGKLLYAPHDGLERMMVAEGFAAGGRQLRYVEAGTPDRRTGVGTQNNYPHPGITQAVEGIHESSHQRIAQGVALFIVVKDDDAGKVSDLGFYEFHAVKFLIKIRKFTAAGTIIH